MPDAGRAIEVCADPEAVADAAARRFVKTAARAVARQGRFSVVLAGGSTPGRLYRKLGAAPYAGAIDWDRVEIFWGDERDVPPDDAESNYRMAVENLLSRVQVPPRNVHPIHIAGQPQDAAHDYETVLQSFLERPPGRFDLVLLGLGDDGHTASLFPGTEAVRRAVAHQGDTSRRVAAQFVEKLGAWRITLTPAVINQAAQIIFVVTGQPKADTLAAVLQGPYRPLQLPAQLIHPRQGELIWMLDSPAAHLLKDFNRDQC